MKALERLAWAMFGAGVGCLLSVLFIGYVKWDTTVRALDVLNFLTTLAVALFIKNAVERRFAASRSERELLIDNVREIVAEINAVRGLFSSREALTATESRDILTHLRQANNVFYLIKRLAARAKLKAIEVPIQKALDELQSYKAVVTGGDRPTWPTGEPMRTQHDNACRALVEELYVLIHEINKA